MISQSGRLRRIFRTLGWVVAGICLVAAAGSLNTNSRTAIVALVWGLLVLPPLFQVTQRFSTVWNIAGRVALFLLVPWLVQSPSFQVVQPLPSPVATSSLPAPNPQPSITISPNPALSQSPSPKPLESEAPQSIPTPTESVPEPASQSPQPLRQTTLVSQEPGAQINVREAPSTRAVAQHYGYAGDGVEILEQATNEAGETWYRLRFLQSGASGWVRSDFVAAGTTLPTATPAATPTLDPEAPIRAGVRGSCDCPYDTDRAGRRCGARSAYSRPGGSTPICYVKDQS